MFTLVTKRKDTQRKSILITERCVDDDDNVYHMMLYTVNIRTPIYQWMKLVKIFSKTGTPLMM